MSKSTWMGEVAGRAAAGGSVFRLFPSVVAIATAAMLTGCATHGPGCSLDGDAWGTASCTPDEFVMPVADAPAASATAVAYESVTPAVYDAVEAPTPHAGTARLPAPPRAVQRSAPTVAPPPTESVASAPLHAAAITGVAALAALGMTSNDGVEVSRTAGSLDDVPADLRDLPAMQRREQLLSEQSLALTLERQALLRLGQAIRRHGEERSAESKFALDTALAEHADVATLSRGLDAQSDAAAITRADQAVADRLGALTQERKSVSRLVSALMVHGAGPCQDSEAAILDAYERYTSR